MAKDYRAFMDRVSFAWTMWGLLPTTWQAAMAAVFSAVVGYFGFQTGGMFYALLGGISAFSIGMFGIFFAILVARQVGIFEKLAIREIGISDVGADLKQNVLREVKNLTMNFVVQNNSSRNIYFRCRRATLSMMNQTNQAAEVSKNTHVVPAGQPQMLLFATILSIKPKIIFGVTRETPLVGKIELEITYGPSSENMPYLFYYESTPSIGTSLIQQPKGLPQVQFKVVAPITRYGHKKLGRHEKE